MGNENKNLDGSVETTLINKTSEIVVMAVQTLPPESGDLLNFLADLIALIVILFLWNKEILPKDNVFTSFVIFIAFVIICFSGTLLMRVIGKRERPG